MAEHTHFELVTPSRVLMAEDVAMVVVPGVEGLFGALPRHAPFISTLKRGVVEIHEGAAASTGAAAGARGAAAARIMIDGGVADVTETRCTILAERAESLDASHRDAIESRLAEAEARGRDEAADEADFLKAVLAAL